VDEWTQKGKMDRNNDGNMAGLKGTTPERGPAKTIAERKRAQRARDKALGIIAYSCKIHHEDKQKLNDFVRRLSMNRL